MGAVGCCVGCWVAAVGCAVPGEASTVTVGKGSRVAAVGCAAGALAVCPFLINCSSARCKAQTVQMSASAQRSLLAEIQKHDAFAVRMCQVNNVPGECTQLMTLR